MQDETLKLVKEALFSSPLSPIPEGIAREFFDRMNLSLENLYELLTVDTLVDIESFSHKMSLISFYDG